MLVLILVLILTICWVIRYKRKTRRLREFVNKFKGPPTVPIFGNIFSLMGSPAGLLFIVPKPI